MGRGFLQVTVFTGDYTLPVKDARVLVRDADGATYYDLKTDANGMTEKVELDAPDAEYSQHPNHNGPVFASYDVEVNADRFMKVMVHGVQVFADETALLPVKLHPIISGTAPDPVQEDIFIPAEHGCTMPRSAPVGSQSEIYQSLQNIMANEVQIPEFITVHLGVPTASARDVRVRFSDYIKNVASSEIYPTWHESALYANIYCQISFAISRVFTRWYPSRRYNYDITNSVQFDQYFVEGRNIFENISRIVDNIFNMFIRRQGRREPFFASYCNGTTSKCDGLSQWGAQDLARQGYSPINILKHYYPSDVQIVESTNFSSNIAGTYPGVALREGSFGSDVLLMQRYLNRISGNFYIQPIPNPDGYFNTRTKDTTIEFQKLTKLLTDGIIGKSTWYKITRYYVAVKQLVELTSEGERLGIGTAPPTTVVRFNDRGQYVVELQFLLNYIAEFYSSLYPVIEDGVFRADTQRGVEAFQRGFGLTADAIVGPKTWRRLYEAYNAIRDAVPLPKLPGPETPAIPAYPGTALRNGSRGNDVRIMQTYLNEIARSYPSIPALTVDGVFGSNTERAVIAFQRQFGLTADGIIGQNTWYKVVDVHYNLPATPASSQSPPYPGTLLRAGSRDESVALMQRYLTAISARYPSISRLNADGIFGALTERSVIAFQRQFAISPDGIIGPVTWDRIVSVYNEVTSGSVDDWQEENEVAWQMDDATSWQLEDNDPWKTKGYGAWQIESKNDTEAEDAVEADYSADYTADYMKDYATDYTADYSMEGVDMGINSLKYFDEGYDASIDHDASFDAEINSAAVEATWHSAKPGHGALRLMLTARMLRRRRFLPRRFWF